MGSLNGGPPAASQMTPAQQSQVRAHAPRSYAPNGGQYQFDPATMPSFYQQTDPYYQARLAPQQLQQAMASTTGLRGTELMAALPPELQSAHYMQYMNSAIPIGSWHNPDGSSIMQPPAQQPQPARRPLNWDKINANLAERAPQFDDPSPSQPPPNHALDGYMQMMGGGNYGGVIPQSSYSTAMPGDPWGTLNSIGIQNPSSPAGMTFGNSPWGR